mmetsp:Transcript_17677/g.53925  ORF Transcript_17677/g.53925 Transcript_17677/m.53925 type:complete len:91 (-) Transcript_17677:684-956(-)
MEELITTYTALAVRESTLSVRVDAGLASVGGGANLQVDERAGVAAVKGALLTESSDDVGGEMKGRGRRKKRVGVRKCKPARFFSRPVPSG